MAKQTGNISTSLNLARKAKNDEFYTQMPDIERELRHYREQFRGKIIFCNCDDPYESNFFKFFALRFNIFGLKKLIATCYAGSPIANTELSLFDEEPPENKTTRNPHKIEISEVPVNPEKGFSLADVEYLLRNKKNVLTRLKGNGDFRSQECIELMKQSDIVVTNPPFSLFREFVAQLDEYKKSFLIIGNKNAITYKETFKLIKKNKLWIGMTPMGHDMLFEVPNEVAVEMIKTGKEGSSYRLIDGKVYGRSTSIWFTNLDHTKRHEMLYFYKNYTPAEYPKYDNYDAIEVSKVVDIPEDYDGIMGVPISFLDKYNPDQFEILGMSASAGYNAEVVGISFLGGKDARPLIQGKNTYARVFIKHRKT